MESILRRRHSLSVCPEAHASDCGGGSSWVTNLHPDMGDNRIAEDELTSDGTVAARRIPTTPCINSKIETDNNGELMKFERNRLESFATWPENAPIEAKKLAKAGFYYLGNDFLVKCFSCKRTIDKWDFGDQAIQKHGILNPNCDFVLHKSDNVPISGHHSILYTSITEPPSLTTTVSHSTITSTRPQILRLPFLNSTTTTETSNLAATSRTVDEKTWESFCNLASEGERLKTFKGWPTIFVKPEDLARCGFFYLRDQDKVQCFFCRGIVGEWEDGDNPVVEHRKHFRRCPFMNGYNVGNIPLRNPSEDEGIEVSRTPPDETWNGDVTGRYNYEMDVFSKPEKGRMTPLKLSKLGINEHTAPRHPNYATYESRIKTFQTWPTAIPQNPTILADAGFYYAGISDHVRCFCCDGGLRNWEVNDDPWVEHARWFGKCCYLTLMKGHEFVEEARTQHPPVLPKSQPGPSGINTRKESCADAYMKTPIVKAVLETGVDRDIVKQVISKKIELTGTPYDDANALTEACMDFPYIRETSKVITPINESSPMPSTSFSSEENESSASKYFNSLKGINQSSQSSSSSIEDENRKLKEMRMCKICMDEEIGVVFLPCGHLISCPKCAPSLKDCPMCRKEIRGTVRTFLS